jgi:hypothetical protein
MSTIYVHPMPVSERIVDVVEDWDRRFHFPCQFEFICYRVGLGNWTVRLLVDKLVREGRLSWAGDDVTIGGAQ